MLKTHLTFEYWHEENFLTCRKFVSRKLKVIINEIKCWSRNFLQWNDDIKKQVDSTRQKVGVVREQRVINTRYSIGRPLVARRTKEVKVALFPYSWIGLFWKEFPFPTIIPISGFPFLILNHASLSLLPWPLSSASAHIAPLYCLLIKIYCSFSPMVKLEKFE